MGVFVVVEEFSDEEVPSGLPVVLEGFSVKEVLSEPPDAFSISNGVCEFSDSAVLLWLTSLEDNWGSPVGFFPPLGVRKNAAANMPAITKIVSAIFVCFNFQIRFKKSICIPHLIVL